MSEDVVRNGESGNFRVGWKSDTWWQLGEAEARAGLRRSVLGFLGVVERADEASNHDREVKLPADNFERSDASRQFRARQDVAVAERRQRDEALICSARRGKLVGPGKAARPAEFDG